MLAEDARRARPRKKPAGDPRRSVPLNDREVAGWMEVFRITAEQAAIEAPLHEYEDRDVIYNAHGGVLHHPGMPKTNAEQIAQDSRN